MSIKINDGFSVGSSAAIDARLVLSLEEMKDINDNTQPDVYFAICKDNGLIYTYNKTNEIDSESGRFRKFESEGGVSDYDDLENKPFSLNGNIVNIAFNETIEPSEDILLEITNNQNGITNIFDEKMLVRLSYNGKDIYSKAENREGNYQSCYFKDENGLLVAELKWDISAEEIHFISGLTSLENCKLYYVIGDGTITINEYYKDFFDKIGGSGDNIPVYTTEEYEQIKDTIPEGTKFIISDDYDYQEGDDIKIIQGDCDLNEFTEPGKYAFIEIFLDEYEVKNRPILANASSFWGILKVEKTSEVVVNGVVRKILLQTFESTASGKTNIFTRRWFKDAWSDWIATRTTRELSNYGKKVALFGGSVCLGAGDQLKSCLYDVMGVRNEDITFYAQGGMGWVQGENNILKQVQDAISSGIDHEVYVFWSSTNDYTSNQYLGWVSRDDDGLENTYVINAMKKAVKMIRDYNPAASILFTTPIRCFTSEEGWNPNIYTDDINPFVRYSDAVQMVAELYGIPVFDLWNCSGIDVNNHTTYMSDGIHPNGSGYSLFIEKLATFIADGKDTSGNKSKKKSNVLHHLKAEDIQSTDYFEVASVPCYWKIVDGICYFDGAFKILQPTGVSGQLFINNLPLYEGGSSDMIQSILMSRNFNADGVRSMAYGYLHAKDEANANYTISSGNDVTGDVLTGGYRVNFSYKVKE